MDMLKAKVNLERTLAIVKPDAFVKSEEMEERIREAGYSILQVSTNLNVLKEGSLQLILSGEHR